MSATSAAGTSLITCPDTAIISAAESWDDKGITGYSWDIKYRAKGSNTYENLPALPTTQELSLPVGYGGPLPGAGKYKVSLTVKDAVNHHVTATSTFQTEGHCNQVW
jgi:hypothetical protein